MRKIITVQELQHLNISALRSLYQAIQIELTQSPAGSPEPRNALTSLEIISRAIANRSRLTPGL